MKGPQEQYTDEIERRFGYTATWLPGTPLLLGDIGVMKDHVFTRVAHLSDFQISFETREDNSSDDLDYTSKGSVSVTAKLSGTLPPVGSTLTEVDAGIIVDFKNENAILFDVAGATTSMIKNTVKVGEEVLKCYREGKWNKHWVVNTELVNVTSGTILISNSKDARIELVANANIDAKALDIANVAFDFGATFTRGMDTKIIAQQGLTPLFKTRRIKTHIFVSPTFETKGVTAFDLLTPNTARAEYKDEIYFG
jgi:hypothetical protein